MDLWPPIYENRPTRAEISRKALENNFDIARLMAGAHVHVMAVIKAHAYGHGLISAARIFLERGARYLGVAYLEEALALRKSGITAPVLVMGAINTEQIPAFLEHDIDITTASIEKSEAISKTAVAMGKTAKVHIKVDTGMERIGVHWYNALPYIETTCSLPGMEVTGIFSHLAKGESDHGFTQTQVNRFNEILEGMEKKIKLPPFIHLANSAGVLFHPSTHYPMVRPGIMLYGYNPRDYEPDSKFSGKKLMPAMALKTRVSYFKVCPEGTGISYNHSYVTGTESRIATLPIGYGDGYRRSFSNRARAIIRGASYPVAGTVCMDQTMVDLGPHGTAYNGDDVLLFGKSGDEYLPLEELCTIAGTIPYELICGIGLRVPRIYTD